MSDDKEPRVTAKTEDKERDEAGKFLGRNSANFKDKEEKPNQLRWIDIIGVAGVIALGISLYNWSQKDKSVNTIMYVREEPKKDTDNDAYQRSEPEPPKDPPKEEPKAPEPVKDRGRGRCFYVDDF